ncbi:MAG: type II toxin-antitoxin system VapC family toxin [Gaiellales bacterium]
MRLLLDTMVFLWWVEDSPRLGRKARRAIGSGDVYVSAVTGFEISTKRGIGRLQFDDSIESQVAANSFRTLDITLEHAVNAGDLPRHHRDPFDRLLIAQAQIEGMVIATSDAVFERYDVELLAAPT